MIHKIIDTFFGWLCKAPLLYAPTDFVLAVCEIILLYMCISTLIHKNGYRYFINFIYDEGKARGTSYVNIKKKIKTEADIKRIEKDIEQIYKIRGVILVDFQRL